MSIGRWWMLREGLSLRTGKGKESRSDRRKEGKHKGRQKKKVIFRSEPRISFYYAQGAYENGADFPSRMVA